MKLEVFQDYILDGFGTSQKLPNISQSDPALLL